MDKTLVAFDCDGVIFDHIGEDFLCAYNAFLNLFPDTKDPILPDGHLGLDDIAEVKHESMLFAKFRSLAGFALRAEDYQTALLLALDSTRDTMSIGEEQFIEMKNGLMHLSSEFKEEFYKARSLLQRQSPEKWADMIPIYPGVYEAISGLASRPGTAVVAATGRDRDSTMRLFSHNRIDHLFEQVATREDGNTKLEQLRYLSDLTSVPLERIVYIDDTLGNLHQAEGYCIPVLPDWGLTSPQDLEKGRQAGFEVLRLPTLYQQIDSLLARIAV
jgi:phosphoglycolate phosphatase-like HAD superfamily hydrolase